MLLFFYTNVSDEKKTYNFYIQTDGASSSTAPEREQTGSWKSLKTYIRSNANTVFTVSNTTVVIFDTHVFVLYVLLT